MSAHRGAAAAAAAPLVAQALALCEHPDLDLPATLLRDALSCLTDDDPDEFGDVAGGRAAGWSGTVSPSPDECDGSPPPPPVDPGLDNFPPYPRESDGPREGWRL